MPVLAVPSQNPCRTEQMQAIERLRVFSTFVWGKYSLLEAVKAGKELQSLISAAKDASLEPSKAN
ncbi:hypothetical protein [Microcoleus sp. herbarium12]|uniref:hypothetical protein n=1 Tax=Microcoleus sp. herbarium12 TaxID=3055437 RepID=UPI002FD02C90